jgi:hypothetical protein
VANAKNGRRVKLGHGQGEGGTCPHRSAVSSGRQAERTPARPPAAYLSSLLTGRLAVKLHHQGYI